MEYQRRCVSNGGLAAPKYISIAEAREEDCGVADSIRCQAFAEARLSRVLSAGLL
jgi:hypothetical protein